MISGEKDRAFENELFEERGLLQNHAVQLALTEKCRQCYTMPTEDFWRIIAHTHRESAFSLMFHSKAPFFHCL
jgi:hypothetical protein